MDYKYIIYALLAVAVILSIIFRDKIKVSFMGLKLFAQSIFRRNKAKIDGDDNDLEQSSSSKNSPVNNNANIKGSGNKIKQK